MLTIVLPLAAVVVVAVCTTLAYMHYASREVVNSFALSSVSCKIEETVKDGVKSSVKVQNAGNIAAFVRVAVVANTVDASGNITGKADVSTHLCGADWVKHTDGYYYYKTPVAPGGKTGELLTSAIDLDGIQVTVLSEAIQSQPASVAQEAWGVAPASLGS